ncbi:two-component system sensor histidine kinase MprB [Nocardioides aromaticivorans]|uniref:histidine kinase n=2 Tax=Nocardioides aromaticivorans TaxID=200618 RepID=A0A7Y9ZGX0_9ACTN|nr:HAMP domain-containing sensor histidine kinase [Nocardioides aromaticivorans]NYI45229.1 two-component system sensor histidine kinase MprB [Nocardioides aromaticivorans]
MSEAKGPALGQGSDGRWHYRRSLASRVIWLTTMAVGMSVALVAVGAYLTARVQMQDTLDNALVDRAEKAAGSNSLLSAGSAGIPSWALGAGDVRIAFVDYEGTPAILDRGPTIEFGQPEIEVARGHEDQSLRTISIAGERYRVVAVPTKQNGIALVIAQPLEDQDRTLARLGWVTLAFGIFGVLVAGLAGWTVASNGLRPVRRLTDSVEDIARTEDFTPMPVEGDDEIARLATAFNHMLLALDASRIRQRQLVADASHELRTPLTALRTNVELLSMSARGDQAVSLPADARDELLDDVQAQIQELTTLIGDLTALARDEPIRVQVEPVDLADVVDHAVQRVRRRAPGLTFEVFTRPWWVIGEDAELERAVTNLLDNAAKWSPEGGLVTVRLSDGVLTVDDQGPGIAEADRARIFDRFWRSPDARTMPGSGLGLAIVRQVAERHSGSVHATENASGGARLVLRLPGRENNPS